MDHTAILVLGIAVLAGVGLVIIYLSRNKAKSITTTDALPLNFRSEEVVDIKENNHTTAKEEIGVEGKKTIKEDFKLKNRLDELEEEVADLADEISELKNRNKRIKQEKDVLDEELYNLENEKRENLDLNRKKEEKLEEIIKENLNQKQKLDFVKEILEANNATNEEFEKKEQNISGIFHYIDSVLRDRLSILGNNIIDDDFFNRCWTWGNQEVKTWIKNKRVVAIVGEFSAGKTSIVNTILKQDDPNALELPVRSTETTAIPTYISKGKDLNCQFFSPSFDLKNISSSSFQQVTKSVLDDINISSIVKYFVLSYKNENLSDISILDTPGFSSTSEEIINKTTEVVKEADALFWVVDSHAGEINNSSINVLKNNLNGLPLYIILNKVDKKDKKELNGLIEKVEGTLNRNNINYQQVVLFSNKMKADCLIDILNSISPKETPDIISELQDQINNTLAKAKKRLKKLIIEEIELDKTGDDKKQSYKDFILDIESSVKNIARAVELKDPLWGEEYYKISKSNYSKFYRGKNKIERSSSVLPYAIEEFADNLKSHSLIKEKIFELKSNIQNLEESKKDFEKLRNEYSQLQRTEVPTI